MAVVAATAHQDAPPSHAGCFVSNGTTMLAVKLTYDGYLFDIPGGRERCRVPAICLLKVILASRAIQGHM